MTKIGIFTDKKLKIDLPTFIDSRALFCANSGSGKSVAVRKIAEKSHDKVMMIILDVEGEFKTLREKYDFLLIGEGGDVPISIKAAPLLPAKLMELNVSTIIDISDLKRHDRILYIKKFLEALMELPRKYWKPCIIVLDEAHLYCGQQEKQESVHAVIDLMSRGRKRGYCGILITQRIAKLHKDACAEANNYLVGRTGLDVDMKRAAEILGFTSRGDMLTLRDLEPGEFYVFGPAITRHVTKAKVAWVKTTHPKVGMDIKGELSPPTTKIKSMLSKLSDLPREAEEELRTKEEMKRKIRELNFELRKKPKDKVITRIDTRIDEKALQKAELNGFNHAKKQFEPEITRLRLLIDNFKRMGKNIVSTASIMVDAKVEMKPIKPDKNLMTSFRKTYRPVHRPQPPEIPVKPQIPFEDSASRVVELLPFRIHAGIKKMLKALAMFHPKPITKAQIATIAGLSYKGGTFGTYLGLLKKHGLIIPEGRKFALTNEGFEKAGDVTPVNSQNIIEMWINTVKGGAGRMLRHLADIYPQEISKEELGEAADICSTGGSFGTYLGTLKRNGLVEVNEEMVKATKELFLEDI